MADLHRGASPPRTSWRARWRRLPDDGTPKALIVAFAVAVVCATFVSSAAVAFRPRQLEHRRRERREKLQQLVARLPGIEELFARTGASEVEMQVVDLASGQPVPSVDAATYDPKQAAQDPEQRVAIPGDLDLAGLEHRTRYAPVYLVKDQGKVEFVVLPVEGLGYGGPIRGFVALRGDGNTIVALSFFEHHETPGLGARMEDADWRSRWQGKRIRDPEGRLRVGVATGRVDAAHQVDGISGATITSEAVGNLLRYWLGDHGYGPFLRTLR